MGVSEQETNPVKQLQDRVASTLPGSAVRGPDEDGKHHDRLLAALCEIARHHGRPTVPQTLTAGLPLVDGRLPIESLADAAHRAGLLAEVVKVSVKSLRETDLPVLVLTRDGEVEVLWSLLEAQATGKKKGRRANVGRLAVVSAPDRPAAESNKVEIPFDDLISVASGRIVRLRPLPQADPRRAEAVEAEPAGWFLPAFRESRRIYAEAIAATLAVNVLALAMPLFSMNVYDRVLPNAAETTLWALAAGVGIAILFDFLIRTLRAGAVDAASRRADARLSAFIYGRLLGARLSTTPASTGVRANTLREFETLREFLNSATLTAFGDLPFLGLFLVVLWVVAGPLVWVVAAAIPLILGVGYLTQRALGRLISEAFREAAQKNAVATETLTGLETIKAAGAESWAALKWEAAAAEHIRTGIAIRHVTNLGQHAIHCMQTLVQVLVVVFGFYIVAAGDMTMGALIAATILAGRALQPLAQAAMLLARFNQARIAHRALSEIVRAPQERSEATVYLDKSDLDGRVTFEKVGFSYAPDQAPALNEVSIDIAAGEKVAFIGGLGSGKSTLLRLAQGLAFPSGGRVLLDSVSTSQIEPALLRRKIALLLQDAVLFHGTIRENIAMGDPGLGDAEILAAARIAGALPWIARLPFGFDTPLRERGVGLSGGQRRSVALARALAGDPRIALLDEPTSGMDGRTEQVVIAALQKWSRGRTLLVVTHRPAVLELVDRIVVMEGGRVLHDGPKAEVLAKLKPVTATEPAATGKGGAKGKRSRVTIERSGAAAKGGRTTS